MGLYNTFCFINKFYFIPSGSSTHLSVFRLLVFGSQPHLLLSQLISWFSTHLGLSLNLGLNHLGLLNSILGLDFCLIDINLSVSSTSVSSSRLCFSTTIYCSYRSLSGLFWSLLVSTSVSSSLNLVFGFFNLHFSVPQHPLYIYLVSVSQPPLKWSQKTYKDIR
jgi:hypothetical protein